MPQVQRAVFDVDNNELHGEYINSPDMNHAEKVYEDMKPYWDKQEWWTWFDLPGHIMYISIVDDDGNIVKQRVCEKPEENESE